MKQFDYGVSPTKVRSMYPMLGQPNDQALSDVLAACVFERFGRDEETAREAWKRLLQNSGWDDTVDGRADFARMVERGQEFLNASNFYWERGRR